MDLLYELQTSPFGSLVQHVFKWLRLYGCGAWNFLISFREDGEM